MSKQRPSRKSFDDWAREPARETRPVAKREMEAGVKLVKRQSESLLSALRAEGNDNQKESSPTKKELPPIADMFKSVMGRIAEERDVALEKRLSKPGAVAYPAIEKQAAWLKVASDRLYGYAPELERADLLQRTDGFFDFKFSQVTLACLLVSIGFSSDWKGAQQYFKCNGKPVTGSIKQQASGFRITKDRGSAKPPADWSKITAVISELLQ